MKVSEFINKYPDCPICNRKLDCILYMGFKHALVYRLVDRLDDGNLMFLKEKQKIVSTPYFTAAAAHAAGLDHLNYCVECRAAPTSMLVTGDINIPGLINTGQPYYGNVSIRLECLYNDFTRQSDTFNIFDDNQNVEVESDGFEISWDRIVYNDYKTNKTTIRVLTQGHSQTDNSKEIKLVPLDKWPLGDKTKMKEKIDKLLILL